MITKKISINFLLVFAFPYISFGFGDTSPLLFLWIALVAASIIIRTNKTFGALDLIWILSAVSLGFVYLIGRDNTTALRLVAYGLMIPLCSLIFKYPDIGKLYNTTKVIRFIYIVTALLQLVIGMDYYAQVASTFMNVRYADGRGLTSVGPEPTAFAVLYLLFAITAYYINILTTPKRALKIFIIDAALIFLITLSSSYILYIVLFIVVSYFYRGKVVGIVSLIFFIYVFSGVFVGLFPEMRLSMIIINLWDLDLIDISNLLLVIDESILDRLSQPILAIWYGALNYLLPTKPAEIMDFAITLSPAFEYLLSDRYDRAHLNTGLGELIVYFGVLSVYPLYKIYRLFRYSVNCGIIFFIIFFFSIPYGHPSYWSALAICQFILTKLKQNNSANSSDYLVIDNRYA